MNNKEKILKQLKLFGLSNQASTLYLSLLSFGSCGIVELTRRLKMGRNVVYRLLDELEEKQLITISQKSFGKEYSAMHPEAFEGIINSRAAEVSQMESVLPGLALNLEAMIGKNKQSKIVHYEGVNGLKQVNYNLTKAKKEFRVFELEHLSDYLDKNFAEKLRRIWVNKKITSFDITNSKKIKAYTTDMEYWSKCSKYRYIDPKIFEIKFEMYIYNDVVTLLDYKCDTPHCVEIHNQSLADMQRQLFDTIWIQGKDMKFNKKTMERFI